MGEGPRRRRVAVVGGGVVGCATAYLLARAGLHVTLLERDAIGAHASGCNAGNLNPLHGTPAEAVTLALEAFALHREIAADLTRLGCAHYSLQPVGRLHLGASEADRTDLERTAILFQSTPGFSSAWLDRAGLGRIEPRLAEDFNCGVLTTGTLSVDGADLTRSLAEGAVGFGATIRHETVLDVVVSGARVSGIRTAPGVVPCDDVVFATGPWIAGIKSWLGIEVAIEPVKGQLLLMRLPDGAPTHDLHWGSAALYRRRRDQIWVGGTMERCGLDDSPSAHAKTLLLDNASRIMPAIRTADLLGHVAALRPMPASTLPIAERPRGWENVYLANGGGTKGVLLSVRIAAMIRDLLAGQSATNIEALRATSLR
jgi:glycine oxidase